MHEYSITMALLDQCQKYADENGASKVLKITVRIGVLSGVVPDLLKSAFESFKLESIAKEATLEIIESKAVAKCQACHYEFEPKDYSFICPKCNSLDSKLISGKELDLIRLEME